MQKIQEYKPSSTTKILKPKLSEPKVPYQQNYINKYLSLGW